MNRIWKYGQIVTAMLLTAACLTGCSTFGANRSDVSFAPRIESASEAFKDGPAASFDTLPEMTVAEMEQLGDIAFSREELARAYIQYEKCLDKEPDNRRVRFKKGLVLLAGNVNDQAAKVFKALIMENPTDAIAWEALGRAYFQMNEMDKAEAAFRKALSLNVRLWSTHNHLGLIHETRGEHELAIDAYISAIAEAPDQAETYRNLGISYLKAGQYADAVKAFGKAIENGMDDDRIYNHLGLALARAGAYEKALVAFSRVGSRSRAFNHLGCIHLSEARYADAIACFEKALDTSPVYYEEAGRNLEQARAGLKNTH